MALKIQQNGGRSIDVHFDGKIAVVTLRYTENKFSFEMIEAYNRALDEVERIPEAAVMVTTGEGKFFSNGLEMKYLVPAGHQFSKHVQPDLLAAFYSLLSRILTFPMPTIAAINGHAFAGGAALALVHDYRVMQNGKGWWCLYEIHVPLQFAPFGIALLKTKLTPEQCTLAALFGKYFNAEEAKTYGIVNHVASPGKLLEGVKEMASRLRVPYRRDALLNMKCDMYADVLREKLNVQPARL